MSKITDAGQTNNNNKTRLGASACDVCIIEQLGGTRAHGMGLSC